MATPGRGPSLEEQIALWRSYLRHHPAIRAADEAELEDNLREQIAQLGAAGLATDEAFLIAVKRMGELHAVAHEFAREHSDRLWKQLVAPGSESRPAAQRDAWVAFCLAVAAAAAVKLPQLFGLTFDTDEGFYARNASLFVLPLLTAYFAWKRELDASAVRWLLVGFIVAAALANTFQFGPRSHTEALSALHLPIALWLLVGLAYAGNRWSQVAGRMDFIRFSGELFIYFVLIALGGGVLMAFTAMIFSSIGMNPESFFQNWLAPCGAAGGVVIAAWLVEAKQSVIENMAPVLTRLFTPLFAAVLIAFVATLIVTGRAVNIERDELIAFDLILALVLGLLLYSVSARDPEAAPGLHDVLQVALVVSALLADAVALWAIADRINEFGFTPNRIAALGENLILLMNLGWSAVLYAQFLRRRRAFADLERWQTNYLPVYAGWAAIVVIAFPPLFGFK
jgi:hypothetical protein